MEIQGYENYLIYEDGRVYNKKYDRFLKQQINTQGYYIVDLYYKSIRKHFSIHRLIALHYIINPYNYEEVDHIDRNRLNNNINNLRWVDKSMNSLNKIKRKDNKTGYKNIIFNKTKNTYKTDITRNNIRLQKNFKRLQEAIDYRDKFLLEQQQEQ
tara:strand:+ start:82 stop:546 length:465 start_codon:yes stop_codon:yes gene_type:complete